MTLKSLEVLTTVILGRDQGRQCQTCASRFFVLQGCLDKMFVSYVYSFSVKNGAPICLYYNVYHEHVFFWVESE